jgi:hypothetical protein
MPDHRASFRHSFVAQGLIAYYHQLKFVYTFMQLFNRFFLWCSGIEFSILERCSGETNKYIGIGATIFFTGVFASLSAGYALVTVFDSIVWAILFGIVWGCMIFNLDRFIVSSMRKRGKWTQQLVMSLPRFVLAIMISIVIATPLELKIFEKEIAPELQLMAEQKRMQQEREIMLRFQPSYDSIAKQRNAIDVQLAQKAAQRDALIRIAQEEADGTGGSMQRNLGPIYKVKKADADAAIQEYNAWSDRWKESLSSLERKQWQTDSLQRMAYASLEEVQLNGLASRLIALNTISDTYSVVFWAHLFLVLLFIVVESAPILVKLISTKGPYDECLEVEEHQFIVNKIEQIAQSHHLSKARNTSLQETEALYMKKSLDDILPSS